MEGEGQKSEKHIPHDLSVLHKFEHDEEDNYSYRLTQTYEYVVEIELVEEYHYNDHKFASVFSQREIGRENYKERLYENITVIGKMQSLKE
jgi:hypothetical protein